MVVSGKKPRAAAPFAQAKETSSIRSVERAIDLLQAFRVGDGVLTMTELAARTKLHKTTVLRILSTLQKRGLVLHLDSGGYRLGSAVLQLGTVFRHSMRLEEYVQPALERLTLATQESAAFYVREGDIRRCIFRVESPHSVRDHAGVGVAAPLRAGSYARILLAFAGGADPARYPPLPVVTSGEHNPHMSSVSCPVFDASQALVGALGLSVPVFRFLDKDISKWSRLVLREAERVTKELGGDPGTIRQLATERSGRGGPDAKPLPRSGRAKGKG
jgi:DNA-binding IclR family transcriptional regulator